MLQNLLFVLFCLLCTYMYICIFTYIHVLYICIVYLIYTYCLMTVGEAHNLLLLHPPSNSAQVRKDGKVLRTLGRRGILEILWDLADLGLAVFLFFTCIHAGYNSTSTYFNYEYNWLVVWLPSILFSQKCWEFHHPN